MSNKVKTELLFKVRVKSKDLLSPSNLVHIPRNVEDDQDNTTGLLTSVLDHDIIECQGQN